MRRQMMRTLSASLRAPMGAALLVACAAPAHASDPEDTVQVGVVRDAQVDVVQNLLYPKAGRTEVGGAVGWMPFDPYLTTPNLQGSWETHPSEWFGWGAVVGLGYGLKTAELRELESATYQVTPDAYRYLGSVLAGAQYAPVYGKLTVTGRRVLHFDAYVAARGGATLERSILPHGGTTVAPTVSGAVGTRLFLGGNRALRLELRDDLLVEHRRLTRSTHLKQNVNLLVGFTLLSPREARR